MLWGGGHLDICTYLPRIIELFFSLGIYLKEYPKFLLISRRNCFSFADAPIKNPAMSRGRRRKSPRDGGRPWRPSLEFSTLHMADWQLEDSPVLDQSFRTLCCLLVPGWFPFFTLYMIWTTSVFLGLFVEQLTAQTPLAGLDYLSATETIAVSDVPSKL